MQKTSSVFQVYNKVMNRLHHAGHHNKSLFKRKEIIYQFFPIPRLFCRGKGNEQNINYVHIRLVRNSFNKLSNKSIGGGSPR